MENESSRIFSENPNDQNRIGSPVEVRSEGKNSQDVAKEPTLLEYQLNLYSNQINTLQDNIVLLQEIAIKLGVYDEVDNEDRPEFSNNLLGDFKKQNHFLTMQNSVIRRYLASLKDVI